MVGVAAAAGFFVACSASLRTVLASAATARSVSGQPSPPARVARPLRSRQCRHVVSSRDVAKVTTIDIGGKSAAPGRLPVAAVCPHSQTYSNVRLGAQSAHLCACVFNKEEVAGDTGFFQGLKCVCSCSSRTRVSLRNRLRSRLPTADTSNSHVNRRPWHRRSVLAPVSSSQIELRTGFTRRKSSVGMHSDSPLQP